MTVLEGTIFEIFQYASLIILITLFGLMIYIRIKKVRFNLWWLLTLQILNGMMFYLFLVIDRMYDPFPFGLFTQWSTELRLQAYVTILCIVVDMLLDWRRQHERH